MSLYSVLVFYIWFCSILFDYILFDYIVLYSIRFGSTRLYDIQFDYIIFGYVWILVYYIRFQSVLFYQILFGPIRFYSVLFGSTRCYYVILNYIIGALLQQILRFQSIRFMFYSIRLCSIIFDYVILYSITWPQQLNLNIKFIRLHDIAIIGNPAPSSGAYYQLQYSLVHIITITIMDSTYLRFE